MMEPWKIVDNPSEIELRNAESRYDGDSGALIDLMDSNEFQRHMRISIQGLQLRHWQREAIGSSLSFLSRLSRNPKPSKIRASVDSGKIFIAISFGLASTSGLSPSKGKFLYLSPLVQRVEKQFELLRSIAESYAVRCWFDPRRVPIDHSLGLLAEPMERNHTRKFFVSQPKQNFFIEKFFHWLLQ
jgi:hypothetical protein